MAGGTDFVEPAFGLTIPTLLEAWDATLHDVPRPAFVPKTVAEAM